LARRDTTPARADRLLFTPGPLTTSPSVKAAMLRDVGSRDPEFIAIVADVRRRLVGLAGGDAEEYTAIPMQGSGTFGLEAVIGSALPRDGRLLVLVNGAYGRRLARMAEVLGVSCATLAWPEYAPVEPGQAAAALAGDPAVTHVAVVHCETTTGLVNPVAELGSVVAEAGRAFIVDAMSSFGALPIDVAGARIDYLVSSSNKCIEGVPGFSFVVARLSALLATDGFARSLSLDLLDQYRGLEANGQFRFTPPTHAMLAFHQALMELEAEGGPEGRVRRYRANHEALLRGMRAMGFAEYLAEEHQGPIITTFLYPDDPAFDFAAFYGALSERGFAIYPGKLSDADCFRIGTIGQIAPDDVERLLEAIGEALDEMRITMPPVGPAHAARKE
jgi:2-aminoethylphosphonate-pyruvate transaminase